MTTQGDQVRIVKQVGAPVGRVYAAFIDPDQLVRWMHPDGFHGVRASNDPRTGGRGQLIHGEDGVEVGGFDWEYLEIVENQRLVMDWQFRGPRSGQYGDGRHSRLTIDLRELDGGSTEVTLTHDRLGEAPPEGHPRVNEGWTQALESLGRHFETEGEE